MSFVNIQLSSFLLVLLTGILLGGFFDLYRVFRSVIKTGKLGDGIGDVIFWLLAFIVVTPMLFWSTYLELRLYVWAALVIGMVIYFWVFSAAVIPVYLLFWHAMTWAPVKIGKGLWSIWLAWSKLYWGLKAKKE